MADLEADLTMNVRQFVAEAKKAGTSLEDIVHEFDDVADESATTERDVVSDLKRISRQARDTGDDIDREVGGGLHDLKDEARQSGAEAAASFSGEWEDVGGVLQETLANGLAGFGPIGAAAGLAAAAGIGVLFETIRADAEKTEQRVADMYQDMLESGQRFLSENFIQTQLEKIGEGADDAAIKFEDAVSIAHELGVSQQTVLRAAAGDATALATVQAASDDKRKQDLEDIAGLQSQNTDAYVSQVDAINVKHDEWLDKLGTINGDLGTAANKAITIRSAFETGDAALDRSLQKVRDIAGAMSGIGDKTIRLTADDSDIQRKLGLIQGRTIQVNVQGQVTRIGNQVW